MKITNAEAVRIAEFLQSDFADKYYGRAWLLKSAVLAHVLTGEGTLLAIAEKYKVSPAALTRHHRRARQILASQLTS